MNETETKPKAQKRPETRIRDAVRLAAQINPASAFELLQHATPESVAETQLQATEARVAGLLREARALRDFAREIAGLDAVQRAMVRAGIEASRSA